MSEEQPAATTESTEADDRASEPTEADDAASEPTPDEPRSREWLERAIAAHGAAVHRYCVTVLGEEDGMAAVAAIFADVFEHADPEADEDAHRFTVYAVTHNRCMERGRQGVRPSLGPGGTDPEESVALRSVAQLRPMGRDAFMLRQVFGLRWPELERITGMATPRQVLRVSRAWRVAIFHASAGGRATGPVPSRRPEGRPLDESAKSWAAIREDAERFVRLRAAFRRGVDRIVSPPVEALVAATWQRMEDDEQEDRLRREREAERAAAKLRAQQAAAERAEAEAEAAQAEAATPKGGGFDAATDLDAANDETTSERSSRSLRWLAIGVVLAAVGLAARWLAFG